PDRDGAAVGTDREARRGDRLPQDADRRVGVPPPERHVIAAGGCDQDPGCVDRDAGHRSRLTKPPDTETRVAADDEDVPARTAGDEEAPRRIQGNVDDGTGKSGENAEF